MLSSLCDIYGINSREHLCRSRQSEVDFVVAHYREAGNGNLVEANFGCSREAFAQDSELRGRNRTGSGSSAQCGLSQERVWYGKTCLDWDDFADLHGLL